MQGRKERRRRGSKKLPLEVGKKATSTNMAIGLYRSFYIRKKLRKTNREKRKE